MSRCASSLSASLVRRDPYHSLRQPFENLGCWIHAPLFSSWGRSFNSCVFSWPCRAISQQATLTLLLVLCSPQAFNWFWFHQCCKWVKAETSLSTSPVSLKAGALDAGSIFLSSSLGSHYKQGHLSWHLFVSSWQGNWCARVKLLLLPTPRCYSYFCARLGNFNFLTGIWNVHKSILAHVSLLNQHFS